MKFHFHHGKVGAYVAGTLLAFSASLSARADYQSTVLSQAPVGYWRLNETIAPQLATNLGTVGPAGNGEFINSFPGALPGAIAADTTDGSLRLPGVIDGNRVRIPFQPEWNQTGPFSVEFWAKPSQTAALACPAASVEFIATPLQRNGWLIYQGDSTLANGNGWVFRQYNSTGLANQSGVAVNMTLDTSKWYHIVATFDGTTLRLYTNGVVGGSTALAGTARANNNSAIPLTFGSRADGASGFFVYRGFIDDSAMYTTALSAGQVLTHYQAGTNGASSTYRTTVLADSPAGYWRLSEQGAPPAVNVGSLGSSVNGSYVYNAQPNQPGPRPSSTPISFTGLESGNTAVAFDGISGRVNIPSLGLNTNAVTITAWVRPNGGQVAKAAIVYNEGAGTVAGLQMNAAGGLGLAYNWNNGASGVNWNSGVNLTDSEWNFAALVIQPDKAILYVPGQPPATNSAIHASLPFDRLTYIGAGAANFNGTIDEVAVFTRALSIGEAYSQYASAVGGLGPQIFADPVAPANPLPAQPVRHPILDGGRAQHARATHAHHRRALGMRQHAALDVQPAQLARRAPVVARLRCLRHALALADRLGRARHRARSAARRATAASTGRGSFRSTIVIGGSSVPRNTWAMRPNCGGASLR